MIYIGGGCLPKSSEIQYYPFYLTFLLFPGIVDTTVGRCHISIAKMFNQIHYLFHVRVYQKSIDPLKFKLAITYFRNCVKTQGFLLMGQNKLKIYVYGISI